MAAGERSFVKPIRSGPVLRRETTTVPTALSMTKKWRYRLR